MLSEEREEHVNAEREEREERDGPDSMHTEVRSAEERRRSMLDHHWAIPSKDRSVDAEETTPTSGTLMPTIKDETETLTKQSCHDSGNTTIYYLKL